MSWSVRKSDQSQNYYTVHESELNCQFGKEILF